MGEWPPRSWSDIEAYDFPEVVAGFSEFRASDPEPGENRSPGYRWGWQNGKRDHQHEDDGYDTVRHEGIKSRRPIPTHSLGKGGS